MKRLASIGLYSTSAPTEFYVQDDFGNAVMLTTDQLLSALDFAISGSRVCIPH